MSEVNKNLNEYDLEKSRIFGQGWYTRELRLTDKRAKPLKVNFKSMSPQEIEEEIERALKVGVNKDKIEAIKADYQIWNMVNDQMRGRAMVVVADQIQEIMQQEDGTLLSESNLAQIDYCLAKCENKVEIAARFGVSVEVIQTREMQEHQSIIDLRRRLNAELEDSAIGLAHDFVRLEELQETLAIVKAHITEYEEIRTRLDLSAEERLMRMSAIPNIISLLNTKEKIISSASKEMRSRKEAAASGNAEFDLTSDEQAMFEKLHEKLPILELVVARASTDNGWNPAYMLHKLNTSIYKDFRVGVYGEDKEIKKEKDMELAYPSTQPVDLEAIVSNTESRDRDNELMKPADTDVTKEEISEAEKKKQELLKKIRKNAENGKEKGDSNGSDS